MSVLKPVLKLFALPQEVYVISLFATRPDNAPEGAVVGGGRYIGRGYAHPAGWPELTIEEERDE